jgi:hypothetical protein
MVRLQAAKECRAIAVNNPVVETHALQPLAYLLRGNMLIFRSALVEPVADFTGLDAPLHETTKTALVGDFLDNCNKATFQAVFPGFILFTGD